MIDIRLINATVCLDLIENIFIIFCYIYLYDMILHYQCNYMFGFN